MAYLVPRLAARTGRTLDNHYKPYLILRAYLLVLDLTVKGFDDGLFRFGPRNMRSSRTRVF